MDTIRVTGYYWVKFMSEWHVGMWDAQLDHWILAIESCCFSDESFDEINENRLEENPESNNEWIAIRSAEDLPKIDEIEYNMFWVVNSSGHISTDGFGRNRKSKWLNCFTHYKPVSIPNAPIIQ